MERKAQGGVAVIWGAGCVLVASGSILLLSAFKEKTLGNPDLGVLEAFVAMALLIFGLISFYMAHKSRITV